MCPVPHDSLERHLDPVPVVSAVGCVGGDGLLYFVRLLGGEGPGLDRRPGGSFQLQQVGGEIEVSHERRSYDEPMADLPQGHEDLDPLPRRFHLQRLTDVTGASGTGRVADGVLWPDGTASVRWRTERRSIVFWDGGVDDARAVHEHGGASRIVFDDPANRPTMANWVDAWFEVEQFINEAVEHGQPLTPEDVQAKMREVKDRVALAPVHDYLFSRPIPGVAEASE